MECKHFECKRIFKPWVWSFFSSDLYRDVKNHWTGIAIPYLFILLFICMLPFSIHMERTVTTLVNNAIPEHFHNFPPINIIDGKVKFDKKMPYRIYGKDNALLMIVDTTGQIKDLGNSSAEILVTESTLFVRNNLGTVNSFDLSSYKRMTLTRDNLVMNVDEVVMWSLLKLFPIYVVMFFALFLGIAFIFSLFALLYAKLLNAKIDYLQAMRLSIVALTPPILINFLLLSPLNTPVFIEEIIFLSVYSAYLFFAVKSSTDHVEK